MAIEKQSTTSREIEIPSFQSAIRNPQSVFQGSSIDNNQSPIQGAFSHAEHRFTNNQEHEVCLTINNHQSTINDQLARTAANQGESPEALGHCEKVIAADRFNTASCSLRASILQEQDRLNEAVADLKKALYLDRGFLRPYPWGPLPVNRGTKKDRQNTFKTP